MIGYIQSLRGVAILLVLFYHVSALTPEIKTLYYFQHGKIGVDIFFVVSGYIMAMLVEKNIDSKAFAINRFIRIYPLYITATVLALLANYRSLLGDFSGEIYPALFKSIFMVPQYSLANESKIWPLFIPGWTITYEIWFYIAISFSIALSRKINCSSVSISIATLIAVFVIGSGLVESAISGFLSNSVYLCFCMGMIFRKQESGSAGFAYVASVFVMCLGLSYFYEGESARFIVYGPISILIFYIAKYSSGIKLHVVEYIGNISYSLYITHVFTINIFLLLMKKYADGTAYFSEVLMIGSMLASILVAGITKIIFEDKVAGVLKRKYL